MIAHSRTNAFDLKLAVGEDAQGRLESILLADGSTIEVKTEPKYRDTGNIAVEFQQSDGRGGRKPSGIAVTQSQWWAVEYLPNRWLILPTQELREIARREFQISGEVRMGDNGNVGVLVPLSSLIDPWMVTPRERHLAPASAEAA